MYVKLCSRIFIYSNSKSEASWPGVEGAMVPKFLEIVRFLEILMSCREIFELLLLVKIKVLNFIGKSFKLSTNSTGATTPLFQVLYYVVCISRFLEKICLEPLTCWFKGGVIKYETDWSGREFSSSTKRFFSPTQIAKRISRPRCIFKRKFHGPLKFFYYKL